MRHRPVRRKEWQRSEPRGRNKGKRSKHGSENWLVVGEVWPGEAADPNRSLRVMTLHHVKVQIKTRYPGGALEAPCVAECGNNHYQCGALT
jgi:hypothetical protein